MTQRSFSLYWEAENRKEQEKGRAVVGDKRSGGGCTVPAGLPLTSNTEGLWTPSLDFSQGLFHRRSEGLNNPDSYLLRAALSSPFHHCCQILGTWDLS